MTRDELHDHLDRAVGAIDDLIVAKATQNWKAVDSVLDTMSTELGAVKFGLRDLGGTEVTETDDRRDRLLEHATETRSKAQETMATVASAALALSVAFRGSLTDSTPDGVGLLRLSWVGFTICILAVIGERVATAMRMTVHAVRETSPSTVERWVLGALYLASMIAFLVGIVALAAFGWVSL